MTETSKTAVPIEASAVSAFIDPDTQYTGNQSVTTSIT